MQRRDLRACGGYLTGMSHFDLSSPWGRFKARCSYLWSDHGFIRISFTNAHWIDAQMIRSNQPSPRQLAWWKKQGVRTVINLRGERDEAFFHLEREACDRLGLVLVDAPLDSRDAPLPERIRKARDMFATIEYPALMHCKSGADRAGLMGALYRHFHLGQPMAEARKELNRRTLHNREGKTGVLDLFLETYANEIEPQGISLVEWVESEAYDPVGMTCAFRSRWWGDLLVERILCRE